MTIDRYTATPPPSTLQRLRGHAREFQGRRIERENRAIDAWLTERRIMDLKYRWKHACLHSRLGDPVNSPLGGFAMGRLPTVVHVQATGYGREYLMVRLAPGQTIDELEDSGLELASGLGAWRLRFVSRGEDHVRVELIQSDPLARVVPFPQPVPGSHVAFGLDEYGSAVSTPLERLTHVVAQGATRSGKSAWTYQVLAQLAGRPDVDIAGVDPTGLLLRPFGAHPRGWRAMGSHDPAARYERAMAGVVAEMDRRIANMPAHRDTVQIGPDCPLIVVCLEEWAGVARLVGHTSSKPSGVHTAVSRLLTEGAKAGIRVVTLVQRAEATVVGSFERDQSLTRLTFGVSDPNTIKFLHPDPPADLVALHAVSPKGVALLSAPELPLVRIRAPWIGSYAAYVDLIARATGTGDAQAVAA